VKRDGLKDAFSREKVAAGIRKAIKNRPVTEEQVDRIVQTKQFAKVGDRIVLVAGSSLGTPGTLNGIIIHTVGKTWQPTVEQSAAEWAEAPEML